jgi:hypothetical protein
VGTSISKGEYTASIFRDEVKEVRKLAGYTKVGGEENESWIIGILGFDLD